MNLDKMQRSLNAYLIPDAPGFYRLPSPIRLKPYGEDGLLAQSGIGDHRGERLQLFASGGANEQYIISDYGYLLAAMKEFGADAGFHLPAAHIAACLAEPEYSDLVLENGQILCAASEADFAEKLTRQFRLLWRLSQELAPAHVEHLDGQSSSAEEAGIEPNRDDIDELLFDVQFCYRGQALTGSELIDALPRNPSLRKVYDRFCDLRNRGLLEGMTAREASRRAQALLDAETAGQPD